MTSRPDSGPMTRTGTGHSARVARSRIDAILHSSRSALAAWRRAAGGRCVVCRSWCDGGLCAWCNSRFAFPCDRCNGCATPLAPNARTTEPPAFPPGVGSHCVRCQLTPPPWSRAVAGVDYGHPWDRLLADLKFHGRVDHAAALLQPLLARLRAVASPAVRVVAVPLSRERLRERGYNQSWELARRLACALDLDARPDALFRVRDTGHQLGLHREARNANLHGAFVVAPRHARWVRDAAIALVDDVLTTGATARAAARTLRTAGARDVQVWVVARTPAA